MNAQPGFYPTIAEASPAPFSPVTSQQEAAVCVRKLQHRGRKSSTGQLQWSVAPPSTPVRRGRTYVCGKRPSLHQINHPSLTYPLVWCSFICPAINPSVYVVINHHCVFLSSTCHPNTKRAGRQKWNEPVCLEICWLIMNVLHPFICPIISCIFLYLSIHLL